MLNVHARNLAAVILIAGALASTTVAAGSTPGSLPPEHHSLYAGQGNVSETGLLPEEVVSLEQGKGMAQALPAEVNGYPGPLHVLEAVSDGALGLRPEQHREIEEIHHRMSRTAIEKGKQILESEAVLAQFKAAFLVGKIDLIRARRKTDDL